MRLGIAAAVFAAFAGVALAEDVSLDPAKLKPHNTAIEQVTFKGKQAIKAEIEPAVAKRLAEARARRPRTKGAGGPGAGEANRVNLLVFPETEAFSSGTIELDVAGSPASSAGGGARGFVGVAFRVQPDNKTYDCFYLRPTNGRAEDQERRNHSAQYISHPEWTWFRFRRETPSKYETYVDIVPDEWIHVKIDVDGETARLYVNGAAQPTLIIKDVKSGPDAKGAVALWLEGSTIAHYANLKVTRK